MPDTFAITIIFIVVCTIVGAFVKGRSRDRCLKDFSGYPVTLERKDGKVVWGKLRVENSGLELVYDEPYIDKEEGQSETSYIFYKSEYGDIKTLVRYADSLDPKFAKIREKVLKKTHHPGSWSRFLRKIRNFFGTVRDSLLEIANLFMGRVKTLTPAAGVLKGQDKYISQLQQQTVSELGTSYEPILERYIGKKIVLAFTGEEKKIEYAGVLKDYTTEFIELMDTRHRPKGEGQSPRKADLIVPRGLGVVRHSV